MNKINYLLELDKVNYLLELARDGVFGTPENPNRGGSGKGRFWNAFNGLLDPATLKGTVNHSYAVAGKLYKDELGEGE